MGKLATVRAQPAADRQYLTALARLQSVNQMGAMLGDWCAERSPCCWTRPSGRLVALLGQTEHRQRLFARLDKEYSQPAASPSNPGQMLDAKKMYPAHYEVMGRHGAAAVASTAAPAAKASVPDAVSDGDVLREELQAAPRAGLRAADIHGVLHHGYNRRA